MKKSKDKKQVATSNAVELFVTIGHTRPGTVAVYNPASMTGVECIAVERQHQVVREGFLASRDDKYTKGELISAAQAYVMACVSPAFRKGRTIPNSWPWKTMWKPGLDRDSDQMRRLIKAGALIAAEIDRLKRAWDRRTSARGITAVKRTAKLLRSSSVSVRRRK